MTMLLKMSYHHDDIIKDKKNNIYEIIKIKK